MNTDRQNIDNINVNHDKMVQTTLDEFQQKRKDNK